MKLHTIIVEDVPKSQQTLLALLATYCPRVEVVGQAATVAEALAAIEALRPELVMLDVELRDGNAFQLLEQLPEMPFEVIFTTAYDQYAIKAFKFSALDYLLKPLSIKELTAAVDKAAERIQHQELRARCDVMLDNLRTPRQRLRNLAVPTLTGYEMVRISNVVRCEGDEGYTQLVLAEGRPITTTRRLKEWEELLDEHGFFRIHRSHLINLHYLRRYSRSDGGTVEMADGARLLVSRRRKDAFLQRLNQGG